MSIRLSHFIYVGVFLTGPLVGPAGATERTRESLSVQADGTSDSRAPRSRKKAARILQRTLDAVVAAGVAPGVALAVDHPLHGRWAGAAGVASLETGAMLSPRHRFRAGSILKTAVAVATLQLVERGELSLDGTLGELLPCDETAYIAHAEAITVRMLLNHTSGIPDFTNGDFDAEVLRDPHRIWAVHEFLERAAAQEPMFLPGTGWAYSNTNYILLGELMVATTGEEWRQTVAERVFAPLDLKHTSLPPEGDPSCRRCSRGYEWVDGRLLDYTGVDPSMAGASGGGALVTTPRDLTKFLGALTAGQLFQHRATLQSMYEFVDAPIPEEAQTGYGLGLAHYQAAGNQYVGHFGGTAGYQSFVLQDTASGLVFSGYMNRTGDLGAFIAAVLEALGQTQVTGKRQTAKEVVSAAR